MRGKLETLTSIDHELRALEHALGSRDDDDDPPRAGPRRLPPVRGHPRDRHELLPQLRPRDRSAGEPGDGGARRGRGRGRARAAEHRRAARRHRRAGGSAGGRTGRRLVAATSGRPGRRGVGAIAGSRERARATAFGGRDAAGPMSEAASTGGRPPGAALGGPLDSGAAADACPLLRQPARPRSGLVPGVRRGRAHAPRAAGPLEAPSITLAVVALLALAVLDRVAGQALRRVGHDDDRRRRTERGEPGAGRGRRDGADRGDRGLRRDRRDGSQRRLRRRRRRNGPGARASLTPPR